jgi:hypothetical protein
MWSGALTNAQAVQLCINQHNYWGLGACYTGPGDIVSGATAWYGLRAYNAAYMGQKAINIRCTSGAHVNLTYDINVQPPSGQLDIGTAIGGSACGTDALFQASIAGTVLSVSSILGGQIAVGEQIIAAGVIDPTYITSAGTCVSGAAVPPCTFNVNKSQTVASVGMTSYSGIAITAIYDQSGNAKNVTQATAAAQPLLLQNCIGTLPCISFNGSSQVINNTSFPAVALPVSWAATIQPTSITTSVPFGHALFNAQWTGIYMYTPSSVQACAAVANSFSTCSITAATISANVAINVGALWTSATSRNAYLDAVQATTDASSENPTTQNELDIGRTPSGSGSTWFPGNIMEFGYWPSAISAANFTSICRNERSYWGTSGSC